VTTFTPEILNPYHFPVDIITHDNLNLLAGKLTIFLVGYPYATPVNSGLRDMALQIMVDFPNPPKKSCHLVGLAGDIGEDEVQHLLEYVLSHLDLAQKLGLFFENPNWTVKIVDGKIIAWWIHIQCVPPKSGHRFFIPDATPPKCKRWSGLYDPKYDFPWVEIFNSF
jgi:hypothetical protein